MSATQDQDAIISTGDPMTPCTIENAEHQQQTEGAISPLTSTNGGEKKKKHIHKINVNNLGEVKHAIDFQIYKVLYLHTSSTAITILCTEESVY